MPTAQWLGAASRLTLALLLVATVAVGAEGPRPNIVYILADDLGYGDVRCFNAESKIATPHMDQVAAEGMKFTDAHSGSAVCSPTRYGILTGRYAWRTRLKQGVLGGFSPPLIDQNRLTVARLLKQNGYETGCVGKWHLGFDWPTTTPVDFGDAIEPKVDLALVNYPKPLGRGPTTLGFDDYFGISGSLDMYPFVFIHNDRTVGVPTVQKHIVRTGPAEKDFEAVDVLPRLTAKAVEFIDTRGKSHDGKPFFLYFPLSAPHAPIEPSKMYEGKSGIGAYGDFVMQTDDTVGQIVEALKRNGFEGDTLLIVTSDNGCSPVANFAALAKHGHHPSVHFRGTKADIFEGGHRIPFIARWPGHIKAGTQCDDTICLNDLMATCAEILGVALPANAAEDSVSILPDLLGTARAPVREATVHHSINGSFAIRQGPWKLALCPDSGGWSAPRPGRDDVSGLPPVQLYNLKTDIGERHNLQAEHPEIVERLTKLLERYVAQGRSTPGTGQKNDRDIHIRNTVAVRGN